MRKGATRPDDCPPDETLAGQVKSGDSCAFSLLTERYMPLLSGRSSRFSAIAGIEPEDFAQEGLLALYRAAMSYDSGKAKFSAYAVACIDNAMTDAIRRTMRASHQNTDLYFSDMGERLLHKQAASTVIPVEDQVAQGEQSQHRMRQIEAKLSAFERKVLLRYLQGCSYQQIASAIGSEPKSVDNALQRVRRKLRPSGGDSL